MADILYEDIDAAEQRGVVLVCDAKIAEAFEGVCDEALDAWLVDKSKGLSVETADAREVAVPGASHDEAHDKLWYIFVGGLNFEEALSGVEFFGDVEFGQYA